MGSSSLSRASQLIRGVGRALNRGWRTKEASGVLRPLQRTMATAHDATMNQRRHDACGLLLAVVCAINANGCVIYGVDAPSPPVRGHVACYRLQEIRQGHTVAELRDRLGDPVAIEPGATGEVWRYVARTMGCTKRTMLLVATISRRYPPEEYDARIGVREGVVDTINVTRATPVGARR